MTRSLSILLLMVALALNSQGQSNAGTPAANAAATKQEPVSPAKPDPSLPSEATLNAFFHRMFGVDPSLKFQVVTVKPSPVAGLADVITLVITPSGQQMMRFFVSADQQHVIVGDLRPFGADPFARQRAILQKEAFGPSKGAANPAILLIEFGDLQCPACRSAQPAIEKLLSEEPAVKLIFQNYPMEQLHPWSPQAAAYLDCLARENNDRAWKFISAVYEEQDAINDLDETGGAAARTAKLNQIAAAIGVDQSKLVACAASDETKLRVERSKKIGDDAEIRATPTLFINGRAMSNMLSLPYETLKAVVEFEIAQSKK